MLPDSCSDELLISLKSKYPEKFVSEKRIFDNIKRGARIFVHSACAEPQYAICALRTFIENNPKAFCDADVFQIWNMGVAAYTDVKYKEIFRHNAFFIGVNARETVNNGNADYFPVAFSQTPQLFYRGLVPIDVAIIQTSPPDNFGYMSYGVSLDITKAAVESSSLVIAQINAYMPRVQGDSFIHIEDVDFCIIHDEPILEFHPKASRGIAERIGKYAAKIVNDGDTIQVGYGNVPNGIMSALKTKKHLGAHTELLTDGMVELIKSGVIDNSQKSINRGKTIATFCMGHKETYEFIHNNPTIEFRAVDYVNNPLVLARNRNITAINSALQIDLTGQASADSIGEKFFSGIGGSTDFMRGALLAPGGKTILLLESTAKGGTISRIVPSLDPGAGVTLGRGDVNYVVTEYGIAYLFGKNIRERAMTLISIAHPKFRPWLIDEAKKRNLIYQDQHFIDGKEGEYPEKIETYRQTSSGFELFFRPVRISDETLLKDFFYSLSDTSMYQRFISQRRDMPHEERQKFVVIDYTREMLILAVQEINEIEKVVGMGQFLIYEDSQDAEVAFVVRDDYQGKGIGTELLKYLALLAKRQGLQAFTAQILTQNHPMLHIVEKMDFDLTKNYEAGSCELYMKFKTRQIEED